MEINAINTFYSALLTFLLVNTATAIKCFDCNSHNNSMCLNPLSYDKETIQKYKLQKDCSVGSVGGHKEFFCRKITQTIIRNGLDAEVRITRGCGWVRHHRDCYKADNDDHLEMVCQCFNDQCNGATKINDSSFYSLLLAVLSVIGLKKLTPC